MYTNMSNLFCFAFTSDKRWTALLSVTLLTLEKIIEERSINVNL